jgi:hypothetical protein
MLIKELERKARVSFLYHDAEGIVKRQHDKLFVSLKKSVQKSRARACNARRIAQWTRKTRRLGG